MIISISRERERQKEPEFRFEHTDTQTDTHRKDNVTYWVPCRSQKNTFRVIFKVRFEGKQLPLVLWLRKRFPL